LPFKNSNIFVFVLLKSFLRYNYDNTFLQSKQYS
jgi:hypothetical protein